MCGRLAQTMDAVELAERFEVAPPDFELQARYNLAPGQTAAVVKADPERRLTLMRWGLVPAWAKEEKIGYKMINARAETVSQKSSFKGPLRRSRCLIPASGFYEWQKMGRTRQPWRFFKKDERPFGLAGLWDTWRSPTGERLETFTIITTTANELVGRIHDRMPVILRPEAEATWLDPAQGDPARLLPLLRPLATEEMDAYRVSILVNSPANDSPEVIAPLED
ncbi:MAG: SOS response-associated peptidase [Proteobacteria bacterium]|nr:SOS response-associated peptidase [Pseudomonadota bacterium]MBU1742220.1 SOS response-associated peptidase [Pseudomonadota bacterium]